MLVTNPKVAILVINFNGRHHLESCLNSLRKQTYKKYDVHVVDNNSTDDSLEFLEKHFPWVKVIAFRKNLGFAKAYNEAIKIVDTGFVALLNNDVKADENWLKELVVGILLDEKIIAAGSKILLFDNPQMLNHAGAKITPIGGGYDIGLYEKDNDKCNIKRTVGAVCGAAMLVRRELFLKIGGFDEDFFAYFEDTDFCLRAWLYGFKVMYIPSSVIFHKLGGTWGRHTSSIKIFLGERNRLTMVLKNFELKNIVKALTLSIAYNLTKLIRFLKSGYHLAAIAILSGNYWVLSNLKKIVVKRKVVQRNRKVSDSSLKKAGLLASLREGFLELNRLNQIRKASNLEENT